MAGCHDPLLLAIRLPSAENVSMAAHKGMTVIELKRAFLVLSVTHLLLLDDALLIYTQCYIVPDCYSALFEPCCLCQSQQHRNRILASAVRLFFLGSVPLSPQIIDLNSSRPTG